MSISVKNITKLYGEQKALNNVSFQINTGEVVGLLGPNGAGKSTMMKILTTYIPPTSGSATVCGFDVMEKPLEVRRRVGYLPESNPLYYEMYVREYLEFIAKLYNADLKKGKLIDEIIDKTGLGIEQKKKIGALSKGYKQRTGIAQALIHNPEVLILDEPTSGLDPNQLNEIRNLIKEVGREKTVILSSHIMQEVEAVCSKVIIVNRGNIVANGNVKEITQNIGNNQIIKVEFDKMPSNSELKNIKGVLSVSITGSMARITANKKNDIRAELFKFAVERNYTILTLSSEESKLEDIFRELTQK